jgi:hypothetical protein
MAKAYFLVRKSSNWFTKYILLSFPSPFLLPTEE